MKPSHVFALPAEGAPAKVQQTIEKYEARRMMVLLGAVLVFIAVFCTLMIELCIELGIQRIKGFPAPYLWRTLVATIVITAVVSFVLNWLLPARRYRQYRDRKLLMEVHDDPALYLFYRAAYRALGERHRAEEAELAARQKREKGDVVASMRRLALNFDSLRDLQRELDQIRTGNVGRPPRRERGQAYCLPLPPCGENLNLYAQSAIVLPQLQY